MLDETSGCVVVEDIALVHDSSRMRLIVLKQMRCRVAKMLSNMTT
jgi:hypothetical protein